MKIVINKPKNWPILKNNKKIHVISPAFGVSDEETTKIKEFLADWQLEGIFFQAQKENDLKFLANSDYDRLQELKNALNSDQSDIIFCSSVGYGSARILPELLQLPKPKKNKLLLGFSDITSLHLAFNNCWNISSLHCPMLKQLATGKIDQKSIDFLHNILTKEESELSYDIRPFNKLAENLKNKQLPILLGGNLSLIQTSIGTNWQINKNGPYSMLIEEIDEESYRIDRMLNHLKNADIFDDCKAIFIGDISGIDNEKYLKQILESFIDKLNIPIFRIENIGHEKTNLAIPLEVEIFLQ